MHRCSLLILHRPLPVPARAMFRVVLRGRHSAIRSSPSTRLWAGSRLTIPSCVASSPNWNRSPCGSSRGVPHATSRTTALVLSPGSAPACVLLLATGASVWLARVVLVGAAGDGGGRLSRSLSDAHIPASCRSTKRDDADAGEMAPVALCAFDIVVRKPSARPSNPLVPANLPMRARVSRSKRSMRLQPEGLSEHRE